MKIVGLTGSIATGKSVIARYLKEQKNIAVFDADAAVQALLKEPETVQAIEKKFPKAVVSNKIDKKILAEIIFHNEAHKETLESILHPQVAIKREKFLRKHKKEEIVFLEVPLLYEKKIDQLCDEVWVVYAPENVIKKRALERPHMTEAKLAAILKSQMPQEQKRAKADKCFNSDQSLAMLHKEIDNALQGDTT